MDDPTDMPQRPDTTTSGQGGSSVVSPPLLGELQAAQRSVALLEHLIGAAPVGLALFDERGCYLHANEAMAAMDGLDAATHVGRNVMDVLGGMAERVRLMLDGVAGTGEAVVAVEVSGRTAPAGEERTWLVSCFPVRPQASDPLVLGGVFVDITERNREQAERAGLLESEQRARALAERVALRLARLQLVTASLTGAVGTKGVAAAVFNATWDALGARDAGLWVHDERSGELRLEATSATEAPRTVISPGSSLPASEALEGGTAIFVRDRAERVARWPESATSDTDIEGVAILPLRVEERRLGILGIWFDQPQDFTSDDRQFMIAMADQCAQALEQARLYDQAQLALEALNRLQRVAAQLVSVDSLEGLASVIVRDASTAVGATAGYLALPDAEGHTLRLVATHGYGREVVEWPPVPVDDATPLGEAVGQNHPVWVPNRAYGQQRWPGLTDQPVDPRAYVVLPLATEGRVLGAMGYSWPDERELAARDMVELTALADQSAQALVRIQLHEAEQRARRRVEFLAEASRRLTSLEYDETMGQTLDLVVPDLADGAVLYAMDRGHLSFVGARGISTAVEEAAAALAVETVIPEGLVEVARTGTPQYLAKVTPEMWSRMVVRAGLGPDVRERLEVLNISSLIAVPLSGRHAPRGVLALITTGLRRRFDFDDVAAAEDLGRRAGIALENALLYTGQVEVASTLQRSLLPPSLPVVDTLEMAARYHPSGEGLEVGGDFYDVFPGVGRDEGRDWFVMVGDVVGTGPRAAATTALVRHTARAVAEYVSDPGAVAGAVNRALITSERTDLDQWSERFCTLALARLRSRDGGWDVELVSGGHPPALIVRAGGGAVEPLVAQGLLVGQFEQAVWEPSGVRLEVGDSLILYTDGVIEARRDGLRGGELFGEPRLAASAEGVTGTASEVADTLERAVLAWSGGRSSDDVAILVVQVAPAHAEVGDPATADIRVAADSGGAVSLSSPAAPSGPPPEPAPRADAERKPDGPAPERKTVRELARSLPPDPRSVRDARKTVSAALAEWGVDSEVVERAALIVTELVTNAVLHAATPVGVTVQWDGEAVRLEVGDGSSVHPSTAHVTDGSVTGRGLALVASLSDAWGAAPNEHGKTLWAVIGGRREYPSDQAAAAEPADGVGVVLRSVPLDVLRDVIRHDDTVIRELELLAIGSSVTNSDDGMPAALRDLVHRARAGFVAVRQPFRRLAAEAGDSGSADLEVVLAPSASAGLRRYVELLERAEESFGRDRFLTDPPTPEVRRLRRWLATEVSRQIDDGAAPTPFESGGMA